MGRGSDRDRDKERERDMKKDMDRTWTVPWSWIKPWKTTGTANKGGEGAGARIRGVSFPSGLNIFQVSFVY